jgi:ATP-dependent helicase/nuclease subunit A
MREPEDIKSRRRIEEDLDHSILVEAGAGSGKTTSLVNRMLALIASGKCTVDKMAAVTFTRKAAAEMKSRFQIDLEKALRDEKEEERRKRYKAALDNLDLLFTATIHSFCARLLRERPIEARLDPDFEELEEEENFILRDECWADYLEGLHAEGNPIIEKLSEQGLDPQDLADTYKSVAVYPEVEVVHKEIDLPEFGKEKALLKEYLEQAESQFPKQVPEKGWDDLQGILRKAILRRKYLNLNQDRDFVKVLTGLNGSDKVVQNRWASKAVALDQQARFREFKEKVIEPCLNRWQQYCHYYVMELVIPAVRYFNKRREGNSLMNFNDLLLKTAGLLRDNSEVRQYFQSRFSHILVDEFQDTDPIQAEVVLYLTGEDPKEKAWQKEKVKPGSLFIVGDPKQSIYRFRRADIDTYNEVKRIIKESGGHVIPLTTNFRSLPALCEWVNPIFEKKFPREETQHQAVFEPLHPYSQAKGGGVKYITIDKAYYNNQEEICSQDAERIASWIEWALQGNYEIVRNKEETGESKGKTAVPGDFMILLRNKANLPTYAKSLEGHGIPYEITGGNAFNGSEEIRHLLNLLLAVAEPEDQVALLATLRGPFYGVSDDVLYRFRKGGGRFSFTRQENTCADREVGELIESIFAELRQFQSWARTKPPVASLSLILDRLGIVPLSLTRGMGQSRAGNLLKIVELGFQERSRGSTSFAEMVDRLDEYYTEVDVEGMSVEPARKDVVRVMNLHKAKGLEASVIFLADPHPLNANHPPYLHIRREGQKAEGFFVASRKKGDYARENLGVPPCWEQYKEIEKKYQDAEEDRLLYVATTRAKHLLVISRYPAQEDKGAWSSLNPYLTGAEELEKPDLEKTIPVKYVVKPEAFATAREQMNERIKASQSPSYETLTVTAEAKGALDRMPFAEDSERGMSWGRIIHRMLEAVSKDGAVDLDLMAENLLKEEARHHWEKESVVATVKGVMSSELWNRMKKSDRALTEVPFSTVVRDNAIPKVMSGVVDLAFKEVGGWVIADYKTDKVDKKLEALIAYYKPQVETYRDFWEKISGEKVKEAGLYFIDGSKWGVV